VLLLCDQIKVLGVVVHLVYPDDVRMVDVLEQLKLEEQLPLVLFVDFVLRDHFVRSIATFHCSDKPGFFVLDLEHLAVAAFADSCHDAIEVGEPTSFLRYERVRSDLDVDVAYVK
jgi:hypothetical protein